ncbi:ABC transporter substrate-binding protein [Rhizobium halophytocola]|uniref:Spermidine/putrescine transport system substrate-binding protein n=1 Tax=Rhizobium halophytocola TaxID=735519 RepID=A0ABS4E4C7_9HYPH|nr:ABC transporter substrate-binding protein [Rhizobium halophytocola]MBP1852807.1 putative spermidine/putrescine transport system substrate-binding protein [Rhizobium halophytocola]
MNLRQSFSVGLLALGISGSTHPLLAEDLIVNSYGGPYEQIIRSTILEPFEKQTGITVVYDAVGSASQDYAKIKASNGRPGFDVVVMTASQALQGCREGLLLPLESSAIPNLRAINPAIAKAAGPCGAVHELQYMALLYRTDHFPKPPASWDVLFAPELKGHVVLPTFQNSMAVDLLQVLSVMRGGDLVENTSPGFAAMRQLAGQSIGFEQSSAVLERYIRNGTVWAMPFWNGRAQLLVDEGLPIDYVRPREGTVPLIATMSIPSGAEHKDAARKFIDFFLEKGRQEAWATAYKVGSARLDVELPEDLRDRQISSEADMRALLLPDLEAVSRHLPEWGERWERDVVSALQ